MSNEANIFILIDALGWEWVKDHRFLKTVAPYRRPLDSVLGFSTANIPSILTGRYPQEHGRLTLFHLARDGGSPFRSIKWLCAMPPRIVENRYVRYAIKRVVRKTAGFKGYFSLYGVPLSYLPWLDVCEKRDIYQPGGIPGSKSIFDVLREQGADYAAYSYHQGSDAALIERMKSDLGSARKSFYFLYLAEIDAFLHANADQPAAIAALLDRYSADLSHLYETARSSYKKVRLHVCADHGMAPTLRTSNIKAQLDRLSVRSPADYICLLDSTMARFYFFSDQARNQVRSTLNGADGGRWLDETELRRLRAWFDDARYGEIYLMPESTVIEPSHMGRVAPRGMHGFHPETPHARAAFLSSEDYGDRMAHITQVFDLMKKFA